MSALVSVIVPNYNHSGYLKKRLESVYLQSYQNFEVILLDDASSDNSLEILNEYRDHPRTNTLLVADSNSGSPFVQWKKGIEKAKGDLIWIAESDDFAHLDLLKTLVQPFLIDKEVVLSYSQSNIVDETGFILRNNDEWTHRLGKLRWRDKFVNDGKSEVRNFMVHKNTIPNASAVIFKKSALPKLEGDLLQMKMVGDWYIWCSVLQKGKIAYTPECLNFFRITSQATRYHDTLDKKKKRIVEGIILLNGIKEYVSNDDYHEKLEYYIQRWIRIHSLWDFNSKFFQIAQFESISKSDLLKRFWGRYLKKFIGTRNDEIVKDEI